MYGLWPVRHISPMLLLGVLKQRKRQPRHHKNNFVDPSVLVRAFSRGGKRSSRSNISLNYTALLFTFVFLIP